MNRHRVALLVVGAVVSTLLLAGCGGGSSGGGGGSGNLNGGGGSLFTNGGSGGSNGNGNGSGNGNGGGTTANSRTLLLDSIAAKLKTLTGKSIDQQDQQMLAFLQSRPEFAETGLSDTGVTWGRFLDGKTLIVSNNLVFTPHPAASRQTAFPQQPRAVVKRSVGNIPDSLRALIGVSLGSVFSGWTDGVRDMFNNQTYDLLFKNDPSVETLKSLSNISVLYLLAHGGAGKLQSGGGLTYAVWTSTLRARDGSTDIQYQNDLADGSLVLMDGKVGNGTEDDAVAAVETHYAITAKFVTKYWTGKFNKTSLVFLNACNSAGPNAIDLRIACLQAGASAYVGWTDRMVLDDAMFSAGYSFDRLLGANTGNYINTTLDGTPTNSKETPPQRAFDIVSVLAEMGTKKRPGAAYAVDTTVAPDTLRAAKLAFLSSDLEFGQLAPSIHDLAVNEQMNELSVNGTFGDAQGIVQIGEGDLAVELPVKSWDPITIVCDLPRTGAGASGPVKVIVNGSQRSNVVPLTAWHGTATYTVEEAGTLSMVMKFDLRFRGDIHGPRTAPGVTPDAPACSFNHALVSAGTYAFSGRYDDAVNRFTEEWSGGGPMTSRIDTVPSADNTLSFFGDIVNGKWQLSLLAYATKGNHIHTVQRNTKGVIIDDQHYDDDGIGVGNFDGPGASFQAEVSADFTIAAGKREVLVASGFSSSVMARHTLEWSAFTAESAPASDTTRSVKTRRGR